MTLGYHLGFEASSYGILASMWKWVFLGAVGLGTLTGVIIWKGLEDRGFFGQVPELTWDDLVELDYVSGASSEKLKSNDNKFVRIPGFMVPLEDNVRQVSEFLLVPTPQACIHVPPPPPNQMVYVKLREPSPAAWGAIWVYGKFKITNKEHMYGTASFELEGDRIENYRRSRE
ncbi:MAG: DUF3299 domain-containing protein [Bdellovibrionaceae bacterium]|nr:DUF3299 domain-containing protein [Pseudobdellovibrionaceae bacterium]